VGLAVKLPWLGEREKGLAVPRGAAYEKQLWRFTLEGRLECCWRGLVLETGDAKASAALASAAAAAEHATPATTTKAGKDHKATASKAAEAAKVAAKAGLCCGWADRKHGGQKWRLTDKGELTSTETEPKAEALMVTVKNGDKTPKAELWLVGKKSGSKAQLWACSAPPPRPAAAPKPKRASFALPPPRLLRPPRPSLWRDRAA
jgi:hypothetical protein